MFIDTVEWNILQIERLHVIMPSFRYVDGLTPKDLSLKHMKIGRYPYYLLGLYLSRSQPRSNPLCLFSYISSTIRINLRSRDRFSQKYENSLPLSGSVAARS